MRIRILVVIVAAILLAASTVPAVAQPLLSLDAVDNIVGEAIEAANQANTYSGETDECGWYWDDWYGWQYWCWSPYYGWYMPTIGGASCNQSQQSTNSSGGDTYMYQACL